MLRTAAGDALRLAERLELGPQLLLFARHMGCSCNHHLLAGVAASRPILAAGLPVTVVAPGSAAELRGFRSSHGTPAHVDFFTGDEAAFDAFEMPRASSVLRMVAHPKAVETSLRGLAQLKPVYVGEGDGMQLGGVVVTSWPPRPPVFEHRQRFAGDDPELAAVEAAVVAAAAAFGPAH